MTNHAIPEAAGNDVNGLARQYITDPVSAQTITGTVKGQARVCAVAVAVSAMSQMLIRVVSNNGSTYRGTLIDFNNAPVSAVAAAAYTNRHFPHLPTTQTSITVSAVAALAGDRIVIEIGSRMKVGGESGVGINFGDNSVTDLGENLTDTAANNPWIEFSADLFTAAGGAAAEDTRIYMTLMGVGV